MSAPCFLAIALICGYTFLSHCRTRDSSRSIATNFHFHGLHVSPEGLSDNIFRSMEPGQSYDIETTIPRDHTRGTYWYHPHHHRSDDVQITGGMAGPLIVEGDFDDIPEIHGAAERVLILNEVLFDYRGKFETYDTVWPEAVPRFLSVN